MPVPTKTYDTACYTLADMFLEDVPHLQTDGRVHELAHLIQQTIEDFIAEERLTKES